MEAFESFVALALEVDEFVVSAAVKFPVTRQTRKEAYPELQTHGYEVDLVGAKSDRLVLSTVKSFFGSRGVAAEHVTGESPTGEAVSERKRKRYALLNDSVIRREVVASAARRYGYPRSQVELRLYVGRFAGRHTGEHERRIRQWASRQRVGSGPIRVYGVQEVVESVLQEAERKQYRDNPVLATIKALREAGCEIRPPSGSIGRPGAQP
jgi:hypothetical protein